MKTFKARGVVLREWEAGESDKRLVLLCKTHGKMTVYARGARKPKSKFLAAAQLFTYGDFVLCDGGSFLSMGQAEVIESFYAVRADYERLCHAQYVAEICEKTLLEAAPYDDLLLLLLKTLMRLAAGSAPPKQAAVVFMFRFFLCYGLAPETAHCCVCGGDGLVYFCDEGLLCQNCAAEKPHKISLSPPAVAALRHILAPWENPAGAFAFEAGEMVLRQLAQAARLYWAVHFQIPLQTEGFLSKG